MAKRKGNPKDPGYFFVNTGRGNFPVKIDSQMHRDLYNAGRLMTYDENRDQYVAPTLPEFTVSAKKNKTFLQEYVDKILQESKGAGIAETMFSVPMNAVTSLPQMALTKLLTGVMQRPSEAMNIENPIGATLTDAILDPTNIIGGIFAKGTRLGSAASGAQRAALARLAASKESGLLSNAYKLNPRAFKPDPESYYRMIGQDGLTDAAESGIIRANPKIGLFNEPYFAKGKPHSVYGGPYMAEYKADDVFFRKDSPFDYASPRQTITTENPNLKFYKQDWLRGYKPVELPKSSAATEVGSTTANIAEISALNKLTSGVIGVSEDVSSASTRSNPIVDNISSAANSGVTKFDDPLYEVEKQRILKLLNNYVKENYTPEAFQSGLPLEEGVPEAQRVVSDFLERISTPEGKRRLKNLGIRNTNVKEDLFKPMKIFDEPSVDGAYSATRNAIKMSPKYTKGTAGPIARHELEHAIN